MRKSYTLTFGDPVLGNRLNLLGLGSKNGFVEISNSTVNLFEISLDFAQDLDNLQEDSFTLATLNFNTVGKGKSALNLNNVILGDSLGNPLTVSTVNSSVTVVPKTVASVPESTTTFGLLLLGSLGIIRQLTSRKI